MVYGSTYINQPKGEPVPTYAEITAAAAAFYESQPAYARFTESDVARYVVGTLYPSAALRPNDQRINLVADVMYAHGADDAEGADAMYAVVVAMAFGGRRFDINADADAVRAVRVSLELAAQCANDDADGNTSDAFPADDVSQAYGWGQWCACIARWAYATTAAEYVAQLGYLDTVGIAADAWELADGRIMGAISSARADSPDSYAARHGHHPADD